MPNPQNLQSFAFGVTNPALVNQSALRVGHWLARGNSTSIDSFGMLAPTTVGTATARNWANTSVLTRSKRVGVVSGTSAGDMAELYGAATQFCRGYTTDGGFVFQTTIAITDAATVSGARSFFGLVGTASALTNAEPTALTNCIGFGQVAADTNMRLIYNDGSGTASSVDLGANFPMTNGAQYELTLACEPGSSLIYWSVYDITGDTGTAATQTYFINGVIDSTDIPAVNQGLAVHLWRCNNAQTLAVAFDMGNTTVKSYL